MTAVLGIGTRKLERFAVRGFKSIAATDLHDLGHVTVLIGPNGAGKSNLLAAIRLLGQMGGGLLGRSVADAGGANALLHRGARRTQLLHLEVDFKEEDRIYQYIAALRFVAGDRLVFDDELCGLRMLDSSRDWRESLGGDHSESRLSGQEPWLRGGLGSGDGYGGDGGSGDGSGGDSDPERDIVREILAQSLGGIGYYHFHDTSDSSPLRTNARAVDDRSVNSNGGNLAAYLRTLKASDERDCQAAWLLLMQRLQRIAPFIKELVPEAVGRDGIRLDWIDIRGDRYGIHQLSDGTLRALALFAALGQPSSRRPRFITIDEPELGLHPAALHLVCELIRSISGTTQVLVATQSPALLDHFEPSDVVVVESHEEGSFFRRLDAGALESWLEDYSLSELFEKNVLGGRP